MLAPKVWPFLLILLASSFCWPLEAANSDTNANLTIKQQQKETGIEDMKMQEEAEDAAVAAGCPTNNYWMFIAVLSMSGFAFSFTGFLVTGLLYHRSSRELAQLLMLRDLQRPPPLLPARDRNNNENGGFALANHRRDWSFY